MLDHADRSSSELLRASINATIATMVGGLALLILYPVTLCAGAVKGFLSILRLRAAPSRKPVEWDGPSDNRHPQHAARG
jgi:hypothetical protein